MVEEQLEILDNPNFTIVVPGGCDAKCKFCFWEYTEPCTDYLEKLRVVLETLPDDFQQLSISGGEPTLSTYLEDILELLTRDRWPKVVLTTNGSRLEDYIELLSPVKHVNISRHHYLENVNRSIFNSSTVPSNSEIKELCDAMNHLGIDVTLNAVITEQLTNVRQFIQFAKEINASAVSFRKQHTKDSDLSPTELEKEYSGYAIIGESLCPVCRANFQIIDGMRVGWKSSIAEPSEVYSNKVYELILHPNGKLTMDWAATKEVTILPEGIFMNNANNEALQEIKKLLLQVVNQLDKIASPEKSECKKNVPCKKKKTPTKTSVNYNSRGFCGSHC